MNHYDAQDRVRLTGTFRDLDGDLIDPTDVEVHLRDPDGTVSHPSATSSTPGVWTADVDVVKPGVWTYRFEGTGAVVAAEETMFAVDPTSF
jgi:hypothetical protein